MRRLILCAVVVLVCGVSYGQEEPGPGFEHLKCYGPFLGAWRYEGPVMQEFPGIAEEDKMVFQVSWRWILNKSAIEFNLSIEIQGGPKLTGKSLIGWNAAEEEIVTGSMNSIGHISLGTDTVDQATKTITGTSRGMDGEGKETSSKIQAIKTGRDTLTWQVVERTGGIVTEPSPVYTLKRVKRPKQPKRLQQAK